MNNTFTLPKSCRSFCHCFCHSFLPVFLLLLPLVQFLQSTTLVYVYIETPLFRVGKVVRAVKGQEGSYIKPEQPATLH